MSNVQNQTLSARLTRKEGKVEEELGQLEPEVLFITL